MSTTQLEPDQYKEVFAESFSLLVDTLTLDAKVYSELLKLRLFNHDMISTIRTQPTFSQKVQEILHFLQSKIEEDKHNFQIFCDVLNSTGQAPITNMLKRAINRKIKELQEAEEEEDSC